MSDYRAFIPFVNRPDLLWKATESIAELKPVVVNNSKNECFYPTGDNRVTRPSVPLTFSQTMNLILQLTRTSGANICIFMHSDAVADPGVGMALVTEARRLTAEGRKWGVLFTHYDTLAAFNVEAFEAIGGWDTNLPWYYSDNDAYRRLKLAGWECIDTGLKVEHKASSTINSDSELNFLNSITFPLYGAYYARKWGGSPGNEIYTTPFNRRTDAL